MPRWPEISVEKARELATQNLADLAAGVDVQAMKRSMREEATLGDLFDDYLKIHAKPRKRTWDEDESRFNSHLVSWKNRRLSAITPSDVQTWHARIGRDHGPIAANRSHALLRKMFNFARLRGWAGGNPAVGVQRFPERSRDRFMDAEELRYFFVALYAEPERTARDFFLIALLTGARRSNVLAMRWEDLDLSRGLWRIPGEKSKNGQQLVLVLTPQVVELLKERRAFADEAAAGNTNAEKSAWVLPSKESETGPLTEFFADPENPLEITGNPVNRVPVQSVRQQYDLWCMREGRDFPLGPERFNLLMEARGLCRQSIDFEGKRMKGWLGIKMRDPAAPKKVDGLAAPPDPNHQ